MINRHFNNGFTLIELSIVLILIGLILSAIYSSLSLVNSAKIQSVISESKKYQHAIDVFESQYSWLPGDFPLASKVWPNCDATPANCNGNGDGVIENNTSSITQNEALRAWQHMSLAGIISGEYSGVAISPSVQYKVGTNIPASHYTDGGWAITSFDPYYSPPSAYGQNMTFGAFNNQSNIQILEVNDAYHIDKKLDDGYPNNGLIFGQPGSSANGCSLDQSSLTEPYNLSATGLACQLLFVFRTSPSW